MQTLVKTIKCYCKNFEAISKSNQIELSNVTNTTTVISIQKIQIFYKAIFIFKTAARLIN